MKTAVITGAGTGVGQAIALALAGRQWNVALVGRRESALKDTASRAENSGGRTLVLPCDIGSAETVQDMAQKVRESFGTVDVLVNAAGTNIPRRSLVMLTFQEYHQVINANLHGAYYCTQAFLPGMREKNAGIIINIVSEAGKQASPKSGVAYVVSKFGLAGLTQSINAEERGNGVRACSIFPGDIDTPLLDLRPEPPPAASRLTMLQPDDVAACALLVIDLPSRALVDEITIRPRIAG